MAHLTISPTTRLSDARLQKRDDVQLRRVEQHPPCSFDVRGLSAQAAGRGQQGVGSWAWRDSAISINVLILIRRSGTECQVVNGMGAYARDEQ